MAIMCGHAAVSTDSLRKTTEEIRQRQGQAQGEGQSSRVSADQLQSHHCNIIKKEKVFVRLEMFGFLYKCLSLFVSCQYF